MSADSAKAANDWSIHAHHYAKHIQSFTGKGAAALIAFAGKYAELTPQSRVLDEGAGTGILTQTLVDLCPGITVVATDFSSGMLQVLEERNLPNVSTKVVDAVGDHEAQGLERGTFTHVLSSFMIQFVNTPQKAINEMYGMLEPGGTLGIATWEKVQMGEPWLVACKNLDPNFEFRSPFTSFNSTALLEQGLEKAGCKDIKCLEHEIWWTAKSAEDFVEFFMDLQNPAFTAMIDAWKGDREEVRGELLKVVRERYGDLEFYLKAVCAVGKK